MTDRLFACVGVLLLFLPATAGAFTRVNLRHTLYRGVSMSSSVDVLTKMRQSACVSTAFAMAPNEASDIRMIPSLIHGLGSSDKWWQNSDVWVFVAGIIPFAWATVEFWRRIAVGEPFGTGKDSVVIGKDNAPLESRGRRTLDRGAFVVAYILFGLAAGTLVIALFSVLSTPSVEFTTPATSGVM